MVHFVTKEEIVTCHFDRKKTATLWPKGFRNFWAARLECCKGIQGSYKHSSLAAQKLGKPFGHKVALILVNRWGYIASFPGSPSSLAYIEKIGEPGNEARVGEGRWLYSNIRPSPIVICTNELLVLVLVLLFNLTLCVCLVKESRFSDILWWWKWSEE